MEFDMKEVKAALRIVRNEKLLCRNCLSSSEGPVDSLVYCHLNLENKTSNKDTFCPFGTWIIDGKVVDFRTGFQMLYDKDKSIGKEKEINS
jgi:hypothetical protein